MIKALARLTPFMPREMSRKLWPGNAFDDLVDDLVDKVSISERILLLGRLQGLFGAPTYALRFD